MKNLATLSLAAGLLVSSASAKISFSLDIESLSSSGGAELQNSGLLALVVDVDGSGFGQPVAGNEVAAGEVFSGTNEIIATWDLSLAGPGTSDLTLLTEGGVVYNDSTWDAGDDLALVWFPNLSAASATVSGSESYGLFADSNGLTSGDGWEMPADGTLLHSLKLFTASAQKLVKFGGDVPDEIGAAKFAVNQSLPNVNAPTGIVLSNNGASIVVNWTGGSAPSGYVVQRRPSGSSGAWETVGLAGSGDSSFTDDSISPGQAYDYQLVALSGYQIAQSDPAFIEALRSRISSLSSRAAMRSGVLAPIMGVAVAGSEPLKIMANAVGPSMGLSSGKAEDTYIEVKRGINPTPGSPNPVITSNDDWENNADYTPQQISDTIALVGARVLADGNKDASVILEIEEIAGGYTFPVRDPGGSEGLTSLQVYDVGFKEGDPDARMTSLSTRAFVGTGSEVLNGGFVIDGSVPMQVIVRAKGPSAGLSDSVKIQDPTLQVRRFNGAWSDVATNDNWDVQVGTGTTVEDFEAAEASAGLAPFADGSKDSALLLTLDPGIYAAIVSGVESTTGVVVLEIYEVQ